MAKVMTIRPPEELQTLLKNKAKRKGFTVNHLVTQILWNWAEESEVQKNETIIGND